VREHLREGRCYGGADGIGKGSGASEVIFRSRRRAKGAGGGNGAAAVREPDAADPAGRAAAISALVERLPSEGELLEELEAATRANREEGNPETERRIIRLRHLTGIRLLHDAPADPEFASPDSEGLPGGPGPVEIGPEELTPELLRAAILRDGCLLVRGLVERDEALRLAGDIDRAFEARDARAAGESAPPGYYEEFEPEPSVPQLIKRDWIQEGGGVLAVDSPRVLLGTLEALERVGFPSVVHGYLGERGAISAQKVTLRKADPSVPGAWHQDGKFLGDVHALNLWLSLSRCGDEAPGLDIVPRRLDHLVATGTEGTFFDDQVSDLIAEQAADGVGISRPIFEPGDALLFDELFLHKTGSDPAMPKPRYALESWFFGPSAFPSDYSPVAI
jgi:hypothetical protein